MPAPIYIYSLADFGVPTGYAPVAGDSFTTSATAAPDLLSISDDDPFFDGPTTDPITGAPQIDFNQVLATNLTLDGALAGSAGNLVYPVPNGGVVFVTDAGVTIQGYLVTVADLVGGGRGHCRIGHVCSRSSEHRIYLYRDGWGAPRSLC